MKDYNVNDLVLLRLDDHIALLTIANPPTNALSLAVVEALDAALRCALDDAQVKAIVLTGAGKLFSAGADIRELHALRERAAGEAFARKGQALCALIEGADKPVIAAINGRYALGGGCELALACHLRLAEESTQLGNPEVQLGAMVGWGGSQRLARLVGPGRALELLLTGRRIGAREAERIGLLNRAVADGAVLEEALALARELAALSAPALAGTLRAVRAGLYEGMARGLEEEARLFGALCATEDWREGTGAFLEKRKASFRDR